MIEITKWKKGTHMVHLLEPFSDMHCRRYRTMEAASMRLQKEAKGYLDSLRGKIEELMDITRC